MSFSVAKNTAFMTTASIGQKAVSFLYFTLLARYFLPVEDVGKYFVALSFAAMFSILGDIGLSPVLTREVAKVKNKAGHYLRLVLTTKLITNLLAYVLIFILTGVLGYSSELRNLILVAGLVMILDSIHLTLYAVFRSLQDIRWESIGMFGSQVLTMILGLYAVMNGFPLIALIWVFVISSLLNVLYAGLMLWKKHFIKFFLVFDWVLLKKIFIMALPFALAGVFARIYSSLDTILLERMIGEYEAGIYSVPYKITFAFSFIPMALIASVYPKMSEYFVCNISKLKNLFIDSSRYLLIIAAPIALGIMVTAKDIVVLLYGPDFSGSVLPLQLLILSLIFSFASFPVGSVLNACNKQHIQTAIMGVVMVVNAVLNFIFIPKFGAVAAGAAATTSYALLFLSGLVFMHNIFKVPYKKILFEWFRIGIAAGVMVYVVKMIQLDVPLFVEIICGALTYVFCVFLFRVVKYSEVKSIFVKNS